MAQLISKDKTFQVRRSRYKRHCFGADKWWRSHLCTGWIKPGDTFVAKVEMGEVAGRVRWIRDKRSYCAHCALTALPSIVIADETQPVAPSQLAPPQDLESIA
jgi:hypothetical protein